MAEKQAIIIGAGPAGLTTAYEMVTRSEIKPIILEASDMVGGISKTVNFKGNRIDIGGHRFFSKAGRVMDWWLKMLPMESHGDGDFRINYQGKTTQVPGGAGIDPKTTDKVMLVRSRKSRIFYLRKFFDYPIAMNAQTIGNLGPVRIAKMGVSYAKACALPIRDEKNLEEFFINRFGRELYLTFFKSYTEKVWGVPCNEISAAWGAQRIKGLSITKAVLHALSKPFKKKGDIAQKAVETSLIERFLYPKLGPGQMWETCREKVLERGGVLHHDLHVEKILIENGKAAGVLAKHAKTGEFHEFRGDYVFSTMPVRNLVRGLATDVPQAVRDVSEGLMYRDFITVGLLLKDLKLREKKTGGPLTDNWIYIQEPDVKIGRLQIFNNWSPYLVADPGTTWLGLEYFCNDDDEMWKYTDDAMAQLGIDELVKIGIIDRDQVLDRTVLRVPKTYPAYFGTYDRFDTIREYVDGLENLYLIGRNGMHRYNNQDHSMLTAMVSVDNILAGRTNKDNIWAVNTEEDYHEEKDGK
ncbi:MAG: NAD(P)/FAD-dependent oxidoreductase [Pirellulales bacterium]